MKNEPFEMCMLFDFYGDILTDKQKELFDLYYNNDLSLAEISEHVGITRQGVRDAIVRAEHSLIHMEQRLGLAARYGSLPGQLDEITDMVNEIRFINQTRCRNPEIAQLTQRISQKLKQLSDEGVSHGI